MVLATELVKTVMHTLAVSMWTVIAEAKGADLEHLKLQHPFYDRQVPVILGDHVTLDAGTGAVHTAPGHGLDDYIVGRRYNLDIDNPGGRRWPLLAVDAALRGRTGVRCQCPRHRRAARETPAAQG